MVITVSSWNNLVAAQARDGNFRKAWKAIKLMPQFTVEACIAMSIAFIVAGKLESAQRVFEKCHQKDLLAWNAVLAAFATNGHLVEAKMMFRRLPRCSLESFKGIMAGYVKMGKTHKARMFFRKIPQASRALDPEIAEMLIRGYGSQGSVLESKNVFESMAGCVPCWAAMIESFLWNKQHDQAMLLLNISPPLDARSLGRAIAASEESGDFATAKRLFDDRRWGSGVELWNSMILLCCKRKNPDLARSIFDSMPQRNPLSWNTIFAASLRLKPVEETKYLFDAMPERTNTVWRSMIAAYSRHGHPAAALLLFKLMDLEGFQADQSTYTTALFVCPSNADKDHVRKAMRMSKQLDSEIVQINRSEIDQEELEISEDPVASIFELDYEMDLSPPLPPRKERQWKPPGRKSKRELKDQEIWQPERNTYIIRARKTMTKLGKYYYP